MNKSTGPFDALFCVGQFFPESPDLFEELSPYLDGRSPIPIPTYFIGDYGVGAVKFLSAASKDPTNLGFKTDGLKICDNLYWLKGSGKFTFLGINPSPFFFLDLLFMCLIFLQLWNLEFLLKMIETQIRFEAKLLFLYLFFWGVSFVGGCFRTVI